MIRFCRSCGALFNDKEGGCPRCEAQRILREDPDAHAVDRNMSPEKEARLRRNAWIEILVGVPLFIGIIYIIVLVMKLLGKG